MESAHSPSPASRHTSAWPPATARAVEQYFADNAVWRVVDAGSEPANSALLFRKPSPSSAQECATPILPPFCIASSWCTFPLPTSAVRNTGRHGRIAPSFLVYRHGLRISEAVGLRWYDIDLKRGRVHAHRLKGSEDVARTHSEGRNCAPCDDQSGSAPTK